MTALEKSKFLTLLHDQIKNEFTASQQYIAVAYHFDSNDLPQLARHFYEQANEERNHAMMIIAYFLDKHIQVTVPGVDEVRTEWADILAPLEFSLQQEKDVTEQVVQLASAARDEGDYVGEQFMQWFLKEQVEEVATMNTLVTVAKRAGDNLFDLEDFVAREMSAAKAEAGAPRAAGGNI
ncbi:ferritin [Rhodococcus sp. D2-41]|uniref:Ferritin n=1 Tax=Speluncibacter jeojiensis TaxID=2710754 RepID=A0A9X4LXL7_9ACTN|nr:ferritin [Rhodococcus sp. D2-41]MDG3010488.1 ferritin [Rhodococcus sp. D2-41]MDG3014235.1 ferritin [Corynebacteriales bacterium D3-21]